MFHSFRPFGNFDIDKFFLDMKLKSSLLLFSFVGIIGLVIFTQALNPFKQPEPNPQKEAALMQALL